MNGFKSFGKHTELLFGEKFNCILGPNGSGKSNVLDSLSFVLGKTSSKSMRAEKSSNLIYNGGKSKKGSTPGEVSIFFDNAKKQFPVENEQVKISRIVKESGQSIYKINDKVSTRQQVVDLLAAAKVNPDGHNIILQGDIMHFVEMHPIERRQLIEEVAGISIYEDKKKKAEHELQKVDEKLKEAEIVLTERNAYLRELKKDRDQALKYKEMNDKIRENKASYLKLQIDRLTKQKEDMEKKLSDAKEELQKIQSRVEELRKDNLEKRQEIEKITKDIEERGEVGQVTLNKEIEALKIDQARKHSRSDVCKNEIEKIKKRIEDLGNSIQESSKHIDSLTDQKKRLEKEIDGRKKERDDFSKRLTQLREKHKLQSTGDIEKDVEELDKKADELQKDINELREKQHNILREKDSLQHEISIIDDRIQKVAEISKKYKQELEEVKKKRDEFKKTTLELNKALDLDSTYAAQVGKMRDELSSAQEELARLHAREIQIKETQQGDVAIRSILGKKLAGVYGTVADLGDVSSTYALALEMAAGQRLKSIVVESDKVAADCIQYLKKNKLGIATFLPLNKIEARETSADVKKLAQSRGSHGVAVELVDFDSKFKKAFQHIFSNTLIVDDIEVARRIGIGSAKMVTLEGDITERTGSMQGGFRERRKEGIGFKQKELSSDIFKNEGEVSSLEGALATLDKKRKENENTIHQLREKKATLEGEIIKTEKSLHLESGDTDASLHRKEELLLSMKKFDKDLDDVVSIISEKNKTLAGLKIKKQELRGKIMELRDPRLLAELSTFEEKIKSLTEIIIQMEGDMKTITMQSSSIYGPEIEKTHMIIKQIEKERDSFILELKDLEKWEKESVKLLQEKEKASEKFREQFKALFQKRIQIDELISKNDRLISTKVDESRHVEIRMNTFSLKSAEHIGQLAGLQKEFEQYEGVKLFSTKTEEELKRDIAKFETMKSEIGAVNMRALEIYEEVEKEYNSLQEKKDTLNKEREDVMGLMKEIDLKKKDLFLSTYHLVSENFQKIFSTLSTKGEAVLELEDENNLFETGVMIKVRLVGNKFLDIRSLSGGEKTMTALAFIFCIQDFEPASFYVLDEVDAALDKHNSDKLAKIIRRYSDKAQYIMISHNDSIISEADTLYGVSMNEHGISQLVSLKL